ncbi:ABC transporter substrate-binding protein [Magnetococcales bacterium HHB-1]
MKIFTKKMCLYLALILLSGSLLMSCSEDKTEHKDRETHSQKMDKKKNKITVAVVWPEGENLFVEGVKLAQKELNQNHNTLEQREIDLLFFDEKKALRPFNEENPQLGRYRNKAQRMAQSITEPIVKNKDIVAVIGHSDHYNTALPAAITYQKNRILFFASAELDPLLSQLETRIVFQLLPSAKSIIRQTVKYCEDNLYKRILLIHLRSRYVNQIADIFRKQAGQKDIHITGQLSFSGYWSNRQTNRLLTGVVDANKKKFDAVIILAPPKITAIIMKTIRKLEINTPFISTHIMESESFIKQVGDAGQGTVIPAIFDRSTYLAKRFIKNFRKRFKKSPDLWAAHGYDNLHLLMTFMIRAGSTQATPVSESLLFHAPSWYGATGRILFSPNGVNIGSGIVFKQLIKNSEGKLTFTPIDDH